MKNRNIIRLVVTIVCVAVFMVILKPSLLKADELDTPEEQIIEDVYTTVSSAYCSLSISSGTASATAVVYGKSGTTSISVTVYLEKLTGGMWHVYTSWSHSASSDLSSSDSTSVSNGVYRVRMHVEASGDKGTDSFDVTGNTVEY